MKPIPAPSTPEDNTEPHAASAADLIKSTGSRQPGNRRSAQSSVNQAYPWLLAASTAIAITLGLMYINKPVVIAGGDAQGVDSTETGQDDPKVKPEQSLVPGGDTLPGDNTAGSAASIKPSNLTTAPIHSRFEETNMRMQHILTVNSDDGHVSRIDLEVPVLYQSRQLRWSPVEVARAEDLMVQLMDYQDKSRQLRAQGEKLLADWNTLIGASIPASRLRADSPSIPDNQKDSQANSGPLDTSTRDAVEIQPKEDEP